jgi:acyl-[acyl-carrier-protein]-phospholipid O-acyltransferase/long-chain-fatty-acid--[acyl-carrier-protein] ligase
MNEACKRIHSNVCLHCFKQKNIRMKHKTNWLPLLSTNFLGVFNDNLLKYMVVFIGIAWIHSKNNSLVVAIASAMLVLPYIFFSPYAGSLAMKYDKTKIFKTMKLIEIPIVLIADYGFFHQNLYIAMSAVFLIGLQSAIYSPSKYGLIRDVGGFEGISYGTGAMEMFTFAGVLIGTVVASLVSDHYSVWLASGLLLGIAIMGYATSLTIKVKESAPLETSNSSINPITFAVESVKYAKNILGLNIVIVALSTFWLIGSLLQMNLVVYCPQHLGMSNIQTGIVMSAAAIGIGIGCYMAGVLSNRKVELGLVPIGAIGMVITLGIIYFLNPVGTVFIVLIFIAAFFTGLYKVPLNSWVQDRVKGRMLGDILAYCNLLDFVFILVSAGIFGLMSAFFDTRTIFIVIVLIMIAITVVLFSLLPEMKKRFSRFILRN